MIWPWEESHHQYLQSPDTGLSAFPALSHLILQTPLTPKVKRYCCHFINKDKHVQVIL